MNRRGVRRILAVFAALLASAPVQAADWYWRPAAGGPYGTGDGRSWANAWHLAAKIDWQRMAPGDRLFVCGLHDGGPADSAIEIGRSGAAGRPLRISGDCPRDPGAIFGGAGLWRAEDWRGPDANGYYAREHRGRSGHLLAAGRMVPRRDGAMSAATPCPAFAQVGDVAYYKPCGPLGDVRADGRSPLIKIERRDHVYVEKLRLANAIRLIEVTDSRGFRLEGADLQYAASAAVLAVGTSPAGRIAGSHIRDAGYGVYFVNPGPGGSGSHDDWIVEDNHIHDIYGTDDAHCIGWQAGSRNVIRRNDLHDCDGSAITFYDPGRGAQLHGNVVEGNTIRDVRSRGRGGVNQRGIEVNGHNCPRTPANSVGNVIRNNTITGVDGDGIYLKTTRALETGAYSWAVEGNTVREVRNGLLWLDGIWYGEPTDARPDPCDRANRDAARSTPGFLFAGNTVGKVREHFAAVKALGVIYQSEDFSGVVMRDNIYEGRGSFVWQERRARCRGKLEASINRCVMRDLADFQTSTGREQGSRQIAAP